MLHKNWKDYTDEEICEVSIKKCAKCKYGLKDGQRIYKNKPVYICDYLKFTGHMRGCRPEDCEYYKE